MKKTLSRLLPFLLFFSPLRSQAQFTAQTIDPENVNETCVIGIDRNVRTGLEYVVWSSSDNKVHHSTSENYEKRDDFWIAGTATEMEKHPSIFVEKTGTVVTACCIEAYQAPPKTNQWYTFWAQSIKADLSTNWVLRPLSVLNTSNRCSIVADSQGYKHVLTSGDGSSGKNMFHMKFMTSGDWRDVQKTEINREGNQTNPKMVIDDSDNIRAIWSDQDYASGPTSPVQGKIIYTPDLTNTFYPIAPSNSFDADLALTREGTPFIAYKDGILKGNTIVGDIYLVNADDLVLGNTSKRIKVTDSPITSRLERTIALTIDETGKKHLAWGQLASNQLQIIYANSSDFKKTIVDISSNTNLGWVSVDTYLGKPTILANSHSLVRYKSDSSGTEEKINPEIIDIAPNTNDTVSLTILANPYENLSVEYSENPDLSNSSQTNFGMTYSKTNVLPVIKPSEKRGFYRLK